MMSQERLLCSNCSWKQACCELPGCRAAQDGRKLMLTHADKISAAALCGKHNIFIDIANDMQGKSTIACERYRMKHGLQEIQVGSYERLII